MKQFKILYKEGNARVGKLVTPHGVIETPNFNPVGTQATVKALSPRDLKEIGVQMVLANTYHLMLRPGAKLIKNLGGLHKFMSWDRPIMTDSGGFQVFSLGIALEHGNSKVLKEGMGEVDEGFKKRPRLNEITEEGVVFQSHLDGSRHLLSPETSIEIQRALGADLIVAFDDHESSKHSRDEMLKSIELTERWGLRSLEEFKRLCHSERSEESSMVGEDPSLIVQDDKTQVMYGVVHGGTHQDLRVRSAEFTDDNFDAIAIGGIYGDKRKLCQIIEWVTAEISESKPRHLLGIGEVEDLFNGIERGIDFFDCVAPTRRARNGSLYVSPGGLFGAFQSKSQYRSHHFAINIRSARFAEDKKPIDPKCNCYTCQNFSRAYLRHLYIAEEILYHELASYHNIYFIVKLMKQIRESIKENRFAQVKLSWLGY